MRRKLAALIFAIAIVPALADRKVVSKETIGAQTIVNTIYTQGNNRRWESQSSPFVRIFNRERGSFYVLDMAARQYSEPRQRVEPLFILAMWIRRPPRVVQSGKTVHTYYDAVDTGETRQMFGHTAQHWIVRERTVAEPGACTAVNRDVERDGWYLPGSHERTAFLAVSPQQCRDTVIVHGFRTEVGMALLETERVNSSVSRRREVIEFSEQPLSKSLFLPPANFARVDPEASWLQRLEANWQEFERSLESWF